MHAEQAAQLCILQTQHPTLLRVRIALSILGERVDL